MDYDDKLLSFLNPSHKKFCIVILIRNGINHRKPSGISISKLHKLRKSYRWHPDLSVFICPSEMTRTTPIHHKKRSWQVLCNFMTDSKSVMKRKSNQTYLRVIWHDYHLVVTLWSKWAKGFVNFSFCIVPSVDIVVITFTTKAAS